MPDRVGVKLIRRGAWHQSRDHSIQHGQSSSQLLSVLSLGSGIRSYGISGLE